MKQILFLIVFIAISFVTFSQNNSSSKNTAYYELGGIGFGPVSLNYERLIPLGSSVLFAPGAGISFTKYIQVGGTFWINEIQVFIPVQVNFLFGKNNHHFIAGYGMPLGIKDNKFGVTTSIYVLRLGYRYQPAHSGFMFGASINPSIVVNSPMLMGGLLVGYTF
jgi:hypothetical protein